MTSLQMHDNVREPYLMNNRYNVDMLRYVICLNVQSNRKKPRILMGYGNTYIL